MGHRQGRRKRGKELRNIASSREGLSEGALPCIFINDVFCSFRNNLKVSWMKRCESCPHYLQFEREMDEEDERIMDEIDEIQKTGVWK